MSDTVPPADSPVPVDKARFWADTIAAFATAGQSARVFCRTRGLDEKRFYTWRRGLGLSPAARTVSPSDAPDPSAVGLVSIWVILNTTVEVA